MCLSTTVLPSLKLTVYERDNYTDLISAMMGEQRLLRELRAEEPDPLGESGQASQRKWHFSLHWCVINRNQLEATGAEAQWREGRWDFHTARRTHCGQVENGDTTTLASYKHRSTPHLPKNAHFTSNSHDLTPSPSPHKFNASQPQKHSTPIFMSTPDTLF